MAEYKYDIYGRRLQKNINGVITNFFWEGDNLSFELNQNNQPIRRYIYENGMDDVVAHVEYSEVTDPEYFSSARKGWYSYIKDQVGTIIKVYKHETKQMINTRTYDSFGNLVNQSGSSSGNLGFQSKYYDQESGLNYYYHRYYYPSIGRFINEDPIGFKGGLNIFQFLNNNSINWIDPYGLIKKKLPQREEIPPIPKSPDNNRIQPAGVPTIGTLRENLFLVYFQSILEDFSNPKLWCCITNRSKFIVTKTIITEIMLHIMTEMYFGEVGTFYLFPKVISSAEEIIETFRENYEICKNKGN